MKVCLELFALAFAAVLGVGVGCVVVVVLVNYLESLGWL